MDAKRWSPLWVFVGGCLTGAALIGVRSGGDGYESSRHSPRPHGWSEVAPLSSNAGVVEQGGHVDRAAAEVGAGRPTGAQSATPVAPQTDTADRDKPEAGNSVGDVLARLEAEYRQRSTPGQAQEPLSPARDEVARPLSHEQQPREPAPRQEQNAVSEARADQLPAREQAKGERAAAPAPETRVATVSADVTPTPPAANEAARLASLQDVQPKTNDSGQQQVTAQVQQIAALQQATLVEQYTMLQYLQLLSLSPASRNSVPERPRARTRSGRIVASLPSSISDTDNPWGFELRPATLVR